jgi:hypothetical protein
VILPFDRRRPPQRNALDAAEERADAEGRSPSERVATSLGLAQLVGTLSRAAGTDEAADRHDTLAEKARLYALPLRILAARR